MKDVSQMVPKSIVRRYSKAFDGDKNAVNAEILAVWCDCNSRGLSAVNAYRRTCQRAIADYQLAQGWLDYHLSGDDDSKEAKE